MARDAAAAGIESVWAAGGDGTICEVVNGLAGSSTIMGVLPTGTGNIWAKQLKLPTFTLTHPMRLREAAVSQIEGAVKPVDLGRMGNRYFLLWAGIGFDALITSEMEPRPRHIKRLGALPYALAVLNLARTFSGVRARITLDGRDVRGRVLLILISNVQMYAYFNVVQPARMDDGLLDVLVFRGGGFQYTMRHILKIFGGRHLQDPQVIHHQAGHVEVHAKEPLSVQVDGDPWGTTPTRITAVPGALRIFVPSQAPSSLFC
jgi:YegS/Rv2252/BmrU family lipid kinase